MQTLLLLISAVLHIDLWTVVRSYVYTGMYSTPIFKVPPSYVCLIRLEPLVLHSTGSDNRSVPGTPGI